MGLCPQNCGVFPQQIIERARELGVMGNPNTHRATSAQKGSNFRGAFTSCPITDFRYFGIVREAAIVGALVTKYNHFGNANKELRSRNGCTGMPKTVHDAVDIRKMLPDKTADARVVRNDLKAAVSGLITSGWATHAATWVTP